MLTELNKLDSNEENRHDESFSVGDMLSKHQIKGKDNNWGVFDEEERINLLPDKNYFEGNDSDTEYGEYEPILSDPIYYQTDITSVISQILKVAVPATLSSISGQVTYMINMVCAGRLTSA